MDEPRHDELTQDEPPLGTPEGAPPLARSGGLRLLAAAFTAPWLVGYGVTGAWAVTRGARAAADGLSSLDVGYSRLVTPAGVILVGALLLAGFAVVLAAAMLVLYDARGRGSWAAVGAVAAFLTAGSLWAAASGGLHPGLWPLFFGGLVYVVALSSVRLLRATRGVER
ncbi:MAG: hypothetical protein NTX16_14425 [Actinobacteria bacterium]|nr:hypothetical protein [Actinomycetota bacterium]